MLDCLTKVVCLLRFSVGRSVVFGVDGLTLVRRLAMPAALLELGVLAWRGFRAEPILLLPLVIVFLDVLGLGAEGIVPAAGPRGFGTFDGRVARLITGGGGGLLECWPGAVFLRAEPIAGPLRLAFAAEIFRW